MYQYISDNYPEEEIKFDISKIKLVTMDIEVQGTEHGFPDPDSCSEEMLTISIQDYTTKKIITWGRHPYTPTQDNVTYHYHENEDDMLNAFLYHWSQDVPDVVTGWNVRLYDIPYLCGRIQRVLGEKKAKMLSPWGWFIRIKFTFLVENSRFMILLVLRLWTILNFIRSSLIKHKNLTDWTT